MDSVEFSNPEQVQQFLDRLAPGEPFRVAYITDKGEKRIYSGQLDPTKHERKTLVPFLTEEGWKSFRVNRVLKIGRD